MKETASNGCQVLSDGTNRDGQQMKKQLKAAHDAATAKLRAEIIEFVKARTWRYESTIVEYVMNHLRLEGCAISNREAEYQLARCVEDGPLMWFGAEESKLGTDRACQTELRYRYDPLVSKKEKSMEIKEQVNIDACCAKIKRLAKLGQPIESSLEGLNRMGRQRPVSQRFSMSFDAATKRLVLRAKSTEYLTTKLRQLANTLILDDGSAQNVVNT